MAVAKTAVSVRKSLFDKVNALADDMKMPNNRVFELALEEFIRRKKNNRELFEKINSAYEDQPDEQEKFLLNKIRSRHRQLVEEGW
jgi:hypothetical protein